MIDTYMPDIPYIYQFGDGIEDNYVFNSTKLTSDFSNSVNTAYSQNNFIDGAVRINSNNTNKINQQEIDIKEYLVLATDKKTVGYIKKVFYTEPRYGYFYQFENLIDFKFFFNPYIDFVSTSNVNQSASLPEGQVARKFSIKFFASIPRLFECKKSSIRRFDIDEFVNNELVCGVGGLVCGVGGLVCGQGITNSKIDFSLLSPDQKINTFLNCSGRNNPAPITYQDKFFGLTSFGIENSEAIINRTLTSNSEIQVQTLNNYSQTTAPNEIYLIELNTLLENEWVSIINSSNDSGFKITWKSPVPSPSTWYYNSAWESCFDGVGNLIPKENYFIEKLENEFLFFSAMKRIDYPSLINTENVKLNKNTTNNQTVKVEILNTYQF